MPALEDPRPGLLASLAVLFLAGCGWSESESYDEGSRPSAETLEELRQVSDADPIYWLGDSFAGLEISGAEKTDEGAWVGYGKRSCDVGSGRSAFPIQIATNSGWPQPYVPPADREHTCFDRIRGAVLVADCRNGRHPANQWGDLYTGPPSKYPYWPARRITVSISGPVGGGYEMEIADLARRIYPIDAGSPAPRPIPPPDPIPCPRLEYLVRWWVEANIREFGPNPNCSVPELLGLD